MRLYGLDTSWVNAEIATQRDSIAKRFEYHSGRIDIFSCRRPAHHNTIRSSAWRRTCAEVFCALHSAQPVDEWAPDLPWKYDEQASILEIIDDGGPAASAEFTTALQKAREFFLTGVLKRPWVPGELYVDEPRPKELPLKYKGDLHDSDGNEYDSDGPPPKVARRSAASAYDASASKQSHRAYLLACMRTEADKPALYLDEGSSCTRYLLNSGVCAERLHACNWEREEVADAERRGGVAVVGDIIEHAASCAADTYGVAWFDMTGSWKRVPLDRVAHVAKHIMVTVTVRGGCKPEAEVQDHFRQQAQSLGLKVQAAEAYVGKHFSKMVNVWMYRAGSRGW